MRRIMSFAFGVVVGTIVATAWANYPAALLEGALVDPAAVSPIELMAQAGSLPVQDTVDGF